MHPLRIKPPLIGHGKKSFQDIAANLRCIFGTGDTKMIAAARDFYTEAAFNLSQMLIKLATQVGQAFIVNGLKNYVPRNQGSIQGVCLSPLRKKLPARVAGLFCSTEAVPNLLEQ